MEINGFNLIETCGACPEQYDVMLGEKKLAISDFVMGILELIILVVGAERFMKPIQKETGFLQGTKNVCCISLKPLMRLRGP